MHFDHADAGSSPRIEGSTHRCAVLTWVYPMNGV